MVARHGAIAVRMKWFGKVGAEDEVDSKSQNSITCV